MSAEPTDRPEPTDRVAMDRAAHFEALVESSEDAILSKDSRGVITSWNPAAERLYGYGAEEAIGRPIGLIIPEDHAEEEHEILARILAGERLSHYETERVRRDGSRVPVSLTVSPIRADGAEIVGASVVARDMSERALREERAARLQEITSALARQAEPEEAMGVLLRDGAEALGADAAALGLLDEAGQAIVLADAVGHAREDLAEWGSVPIDADLPMSRAIRDLSPTWSPTREDLTGRFPSLAGRGLRYTALAVLPLAVEGRPLGVVAFSFAERRSFTAEERAFAGSMVQQAAYSLERARLYAAERRARQRLSLLAAASEVLNETLDVRDTLRRLADLSVRRLSDWCAVDLVGEGGEIEAAVISHVEQGKLDLARRFRRRYPPDPRAPAGVGRVIRTGKPELYRTIDDELLVEAARDEEHLGAMRELGLLSAMVVPLTARGRTLGALTFASASPERTFDDEDLELAGDLARRAALAVDTSVLYQREHETALTLQRALLPGSVPDVEGLEVAARYLPAAAGLEVGGDWYDVIESDGGRIEVLIGDVAGRGIHAAAVMGRLATGLRAYLLGGRPVEAAVAGLDRLMRDFDSPQMATLFALDLELATGRARYVRAGHPPALLRLPDGEVVDLHGDGCPPLGVLDEPRFVASTTGVPPGSMLLLYTDGLVERRVPDHQIGLEELRRAFAGAPARPEAALEHVLTALDAERVPDDIALLAACFRGAGPRLTAPPQAAARS